MAQLSMVAGATVPALLEHTIGEALDRAVKRWPDAEALVSAHQDIRWTWAEFGQRVDAVAAGLLTLGLNPGDRVGVWAPNCAEWTLVQFATAKAGLIQVNINPAYRLSEIEYTLKKVGVKVLVSARAIQVQRLCRHDRDPGAGDPGVEAGRAEVSAAAGPARRGADRRGQAAGLDGVRRTAACAPPDAIATDLAEIWRNVGPQRRDQHPVHQRHHRLAQGRDAVASQHPQQWLFRRRGDGPWRGRPALHSGAALSLLRHGDGQSCLRHSRRDDGLSVGRVSTLRRCCGRVEAERCTALYGVPTMFIAVLEHPGFDGFDLSSLRTGIMAGAPCPNEVMRKVIERMNMRDVRIAYGMTETSPVSFQTSRDDPLERRVSTVGRVQPHLEVKVDRRRRA